jgi:hypothetical protein
MSNLSNQTFLFQPRKMPDVKKALELGVVQALANGLNEPISAKVHSSVINHSVLEPEGEVFTITMKVTVHRKQEEQKISPN